MKAIQKRIPLSYVVAQRDQVVHTLEGPVLARDGDVILTGVQGEQWPVPAREFPARYSVDPDLRRCYAKPNVVDAELIDDAFEVRTRSGAMLRGKAGDYRLTYRNGDRAVIDATIFSKTYDLL